MVFDWAEEGSCREAINELLSDKDFADRDTIKDWAQKSISAEAGAEYYLKIIDSTYNGKEKPAIPWVS